MADGYLNKCKECAKKDSKIHIENNKEYIRQYEKLRSNLPHRIKARADYQKTNNGRLAYLNANKKWKEKNPEKYKAHTLVNNKIRSGELIKKPCRKCGNERSHAHHKDYTKPLDVIWLCNKCHKIMHKLEILKEKLNGY